VIENSRLYDVSAGVQLLGHVYADNVFPISLRWKANGSAVDFHFGTAHCANAQARY